MAKDVTTLVWRKKVVFNNRKEDWKERTECRTGQQA